jgi:hypothetical protein
MSYFAIYRGWVQHGSERPAIQEAPEPFNLDALDEVTETRPAPIAPRGSHHRPLGSPLTPRPRWLWRAGLPTNRQGTP